MLASKNIMNSSKECAFLTLEDPTGFFIYDELTVAPLAELGWSVTSIPWNRAGVEWDAFEVVVIRSAWTTRVMSQAF